MRVAAVALDTIGHIENDAGRAALRSGWHEPAKCRKQLLVALAQQRVVAALRERGQYGLDGLASVFLRTPLTEAVDDAVIGTVPHDGYPHDMLPIWPPLAIFIPAVRGDRADLIVASRFVRPCRTAIRADSRPRTTGTPGTC